ncbi:unnamed protein product [Paramecium sonneborni]|uniref:Mitochondrial import inner membrane translocase subunit TIM50 n=1 Tax=Paramecium sonneborni TaxID=65129 RepID=A0A8S1R609_9CILI|nr:unnamed protein product [Paramecium sonneborni]
MKQTLPVLAHFEKSSDEIASNLKYFTLKYGTNYHIIKQLQNQRKQLETPMIEAKRTLRTIEQDSEGTKRSYSKQSERIKATSTSNFSRPDSQFDTFIQNTQHFDLKSALLLLQNIKQIMECLQNKENTPNFQLYWESVYMFKWEQYIYYFIRPITQKTIQESIFLMDIVISFIQCQMKENLINNNSQEYQQEMTVLTKFILENFCHFLKRILTQTKQQNNTLLIEIQNKIDLILCKNNPCFSFIQELKRNNSFIKNIIEKLLKNDNNNIQPVIITCRYQLSQIKTLDIQSSRPQLVNAIYLSTSVVQQTEYQSPLKTLFKIPHQQQYAMQLRQSYSNLEKIQAPFIQEPFEHLLCVILDLDETMGHYSDKIGKFIQRPGLVELLQGIKEDCEIIVFTAGLQSYADQAIRELQCDQYIDHKLYRNHTTFNGNNFIKDISKVGRPLERTIIIDNTPTNYELQQDNGLLVSTWIDQEEDRELFQLKDLIIKLAKAKTKDVRKALKKYRDYISGHK